MGADGQLMPQQQQTRKSTAVRLRLDYRDGTSVDVVVGAFAQMAAKRHLGVDVAKSGDPEFVLFGAWVERNGRPAGTPDEISAAFDEWLMTVEGFLPDGMEGGDDDEDPPSESSDPSPDSPSTSGSLPAS